MERWEGTDVEHLSPVSAGRFVYDHAGQRVLKGVGRGGAPEDLTLYVAEDTEVRKGWQLTKYVFAGSERLAKLVDGDGTTDVLPGFKSYHFYYHPDMLHTASVVTDDDGQLVERRNYLPFGPPEADQSQPPYATYHEPYGFTGKELDEDFGLQYFGARYYAPALGRWMSADPLYLWSPERAADAPAKLSLYAYVGGDPLTLVDPDGREAASVGPPRSYTDAELQRMREWRRTQGEVVQALEREGRPVTQRQADLLEAERMPIATCGAGGAGRGLKQIADKAPTAVGLLTRAFSRLGAGLRRAFSRQGPAQLPPTEVAPPELAKPARAYNRQEHYGRTPTAADRKALGAKKGEVVDHEPPLVKRFYEGDPATGEKPGYQMPAERRASANDRSRMQVQPEPASDAQGADMSRYSREKKKEQGL